MSESQDLGKRRFRANPDYTFVPIDQLTKDDLAQLGRIGQDPDTAGLLIPRMGSGLGIKAICPATARLFQDLDTPAPLPDALDAEISGEVSGSVLPLVLDGILEVEWEGDFLHGPRAGELLTTVEESSFGDGPIATLSRDALRYGQSLALDDPIRLSARMYFYNRRPLTPELARAFPTAGRIADWLGIGPDGPVRALLDRHWRELEDASGGEFWRVWTRSRSVPLGSPRFKLYVSPRFEQLGTVFREIVEVFASGRVNRFKAGAHSLDGLLRPDKIVAYFSRSEDLREVASRLSRILDGVPAQGVPFSGGLEGGALLSWGIDPPPEHRLDLPWGGQESWRLWLTNRLAVMLLAARSEPVAGSEPWQFVVTRIRMEGVDTRQWAPSPDLWA